MSLLSELLLLLLLPLDEALRLPLLSRPELLLERLAEPASIPPSFFVAELSASASPCLPRSVRLVFGLDELDESDESDDFDGLDDPDLAVELSWVDGSPFTWSVFGPLLLGF